MPELKDSSRDGWMDAEVDVGLFPAFVTVHNSFLTLLFDSGIHTHILITHRKRSVCIIWRIEHKHLPREIRIRSSGP